MPVGDHSLVPVHPGEHSFHIPVMNGFIPATRTSMLLLILREAAEEVPDSLEEVSLIEHLVAMPDM